VHAGFKKAAAKAWRIRVYAAFHHMRSKNYVVNARGRGSYAAFHDLEGRLWLKVQKAFAIRRPRLKAAAPRRVEV